MPPCATLKPQAGDHRVSGLGEFDRRKFLALLGAAGGLALTSCTKAPEPGRYTQADIDLLARQRRLEAESTGTGPYGEQLYRGYRGLARLPWFDLDQNGGLICTDEAVPEAIDVHCHLGISTFIAPEIDLLARPARVKHLLDCDAETPGCELDLDVYMNSNFTGEAIKTLERNTLAQGLWGSDFARTQTIPGLLAEMNAMRVRQAFILPIKFNLPFGDGLTEQWRTAIEKAGASERLIDGLSVHPRGRNRIDEMRAHAATGARLMKLHPTVQAFYPDDPDMMAVYEEARDLGLVIFFHGGRAGIEPASRQRYAMPRHYKAVLANFPQLQVVLGHAGARDGEAMLDLALQYDNAWLDIHGQGVSRLNAIIRRTRGRRVLFGSDWPFYHIGSSLAKVLICTDRPDRADIRRNILRDNALALFPELRQA